jgi:hypothetical protein
LGSLKAPEGLTPARWQDAPDTGRAKVLLRSLKAGLQRDTGRAKVLLRSLKAGLQHGGSVPPIREERRCVAQPDGWTPTRWQDEGVAAVWWGSPRKCTKIHKKQRGPRLAPSAQGLEQRGPRLAPSAQVDSFFEDFRGCRVATTTRSHTIEPILAKRWRGKNTEGSMMKGG